MIVLLVGLPGVGKTSVINRAKEYLKKNVKVINFGDVIFEICKNKYNIQNRDEIRKRLSKVDYEEVQKEAAEKIVEISAEETVILDTHLFIETNFGFFSGTPKHVVDKLKPIGIIVITAPPEQILKRRLKDESRRRDVESKERIKLHQDLTIMHAVSIAYEHQCPIEVIVNEEGKLEEAAKKLSDIVNKLIK